MLTYTTTHKEQLKHKRFRPMVFVWCRREREKIIKKKEAKKKIDKKLSSLA